LMASNTKQIEAARQRRVISIQARVERWETKVKPLLDTVAFTMRERVRIATEHLRNKVVLNISRPVTKYTGSISKRVQVRDRSKAGEFPKADTTMLIKNIFGHTAVLEGGVWEGYVGTTLSYGAILETSEWLDRKYLTRTMLEETETIVGILSGPLK
jgi:hypothetical protein